MLHNPTTEPLSMLFFLPRTQVLNLGFTDESQGVCEPPGSAYQISYTFAHVHHSGKEVHRMHQTYKASVIQGCLKSTHYLLFYKITLSLPGVNLFLYWQMIIESPLCARHCSSHMGYSSEQNK